MLTLLHEVYANKPFMYTSPLKLSLNLICKYSLSNKSSLGPVSPHVFLFYSFLQVWIRIPNLIQPTYVTITSQLNFSIFYEYIWLQTIIYMYIYFINMHNNMQNNVHNNV